VSFFNRKGLELNRREGLAALLGPIAFAGLGGLSLHADAALTAPTPVIKDLWADFKKRFVGVDGSVADTGNRGITHTEGLGVAMLFAQEADDPVAFKSIADFSKKLLRPDGLHSWKWTRKDGIIDPNNASDGDVYLAWAYLRAALRWRRDDYLTQARNLVLSLERRCVVSSNGKQYLLPGVDGFVRTQDGNSFPVLNPSYWVFPAFKEFRVIGTGTLWEALYRDARQLLQASPWALSGLPADWVELKDPVIPWRERPARFGYEAIRVPLFLVWERHDTDRAVRAAGKVMSKDKFPAWTSLDGQEAAEYEAPPGFKAVSALVKRAVFGLPLSTRFRLDGDYYSSSLVLLGAMAARQRGWL